MKNVIAVLGGFYFFVASAVCSSEPLTLNNDSITKAENLKVIRIDKSSRSTVRLPTASNSQQTAAPSIRPTSGYTTIDVNGPKAPPIFSGTLIKQGSARVNWRTIPHVYIVSHKGNIVWQGFPGKVRTLETAIREAIRYRDGA